MKREHVRSVGVIGAAGAAGAGLAGPIVLAGGSGFLGRALAAALALRGENVVVLTRAPGSVLPDDTRQGVTFMAWDGRTQGEWSNAIDGARAVVNLAGRSVNCR